VKSIKELRKQPRDTSTKINSKISLKSTIREKVTPMKTNSKTFEGDHQRQGIPVPATPKSSLFPVIEEQKLKSKSHKSSSNVRNSRDSRMPPSKRLKFVKMNISMANSE
jgi:hypothetical protein